MWQGDSVMTPEIGTAQESGLSRVGSGRTTSYEVGVAIMPIAPVNGDGHEPSVTVGSVPGFDETMGKGQSQSERRSALIEKGEEAVCAATEAIAGQIGLTAQRITAAIEAQVNMTPDQGAFGLDAVQVSFGVTLSAGLQVMFTAQMESSAQVTITLCRQPARPEQRQ
jgi:hypothetical protein